MNIIKNINLRNKLFLILLLLLLPLSYFAVTAWSNEKEKVDALEVTYISLQEAEKVSTVLSNIQKERALSYIFYMTAGERFKQTLAEQRLKTDKAILDYSVFIEKNKLSNTLEESYSALDIHRKEIDDLTIDSLALENYFGGIVTKFSEKLELIAASMNETIVRSRMEAYIDFLKTKFYISQIRTIITKSVSAGMVDTPDLVFISGRKSLLDASEDNFIKNTPPEVYDFYQEKATEENANNVRTFINEKLLKNADLTGEDMFYWYDTFTDYLETLQEVDTYIMASLQSYILNKKLEADRRLIGYIIFFAITLIFGVLLAVYIINDLLNAIRRLKIVADKVATGNVDIDISLSTNSNDEIGSLAKSFKTVVEKNQHLAEVARAIGRGDYTPNIIVNSEKDLLANALQKMKDSLKRLSEKDKKHSWLLVGNAELNDLISTDRSLQSVSDKIISHTCQYIGAEIGAFYLLNEQSNLEFITGYAFHPNNFEEGASNLATQALKNKKIIRLENITTTEFKIETGLSASEVAEVLVVPFYIQEQPVGVMEIAARGKFAEDKIEYLERVTEKIATAITTLKADIKTADLLSETQAQAEELESQHEELRLINQELINQKDKLQLSEEELKTNQEELEEKNAELEEKTKQLQEHYGIISNKNKELETARQAIQLQLDELHRVSKYRSDFLANMSHELRTPLNSILILAKLISENKERNLTDKQVEFAEVIHNSGNDLLKLINEVLDLTKIEAGKLSLEVKDFDLKALNLKPLFKEVAKEKNIEFTISFSENLPSKILSDQFRIEQILKNLLSNAFKFTEEGGKVSLEVFVPDAATTFKNMTLKEADTVIGFAVNDSGKGISKENQAVIFDAFKQADSSITRKYGGTGLGLSICKELAQILGGELHLESEIDKGARFTLYIPNKFDFVEEVLNEVTAIPDREVEKGHKAIEQMLVKTQEPDILNKEKSILIIEDDKGFSRILADFAKGRKIKPYTTHLGKKGLAMMREIRPSAVLLDINLPDISGWEVLEQIKKDKSIKDIPVHIMSAYELDTKKQGLSKDSYLPKPVTLENLDKAFFSINNLNNTEVKKVLIVEDNEVESLAVKELLLAHELASDVAHDGPEAFKKLTKSKYDCIILDMNLPGMGGYEILDRLKANKQFKEIPVIVYSGKDFAEEEEFKLKQYVNAIVIKTDYSYKRLLDEVKLFLHKVQEKLPAISKDKLYISDESLKKRKVLIVDDDSRNIYALYNAFETEQMQIVVANNGFEALKKLEENRDINIVLMDIMMPEMDGLECTKRIRALPYFKNLPIIALTAKAMKEDKERCLKAGASDYVTKPINVEKLLSLMRVWIYKNENIRLY